MRFLCLHGSGTNSNIMRMQTSPLRHELEDDEHEFEFVEAVIECHMSEDVGVITSPGERFFAWFDDQDLTTLRANMKLLDSYIDTEGPFDGVMGFSAGAVLAAIYLAEKSRQGAIAPFKCAIFLSSGINVPAQEFLGVGAPSSLIRIPTAHIWGSADKVAPTGGEDLSQLCDPEKRSIAVHDGGHEVPKKKYLTEAVHMIRRTVHLAT